MFWLFDRAMVMQGFIHWFSHSTVCFKLHLHVQPISSKAHSADMTLCLDFDAQHTRPSEEKKGGVREELVRYKGKQMAHH